MNTTEEKQIIEIGKIVAEYYKIDIFQLCKVSRKREIVQPRQMAHALCKLATDLSLENIGKILGGKDRVTVLHGIKTIKNLYDTNKYIMLDYEYLKHKIERNIFSKVHKAKVNITKSKQLQRARIASIRNNPNKYNHGDAKIQSARY